MPLLFRLLVLDFGVLKLPELVLLEDLVVDSGDDVLVLFVELVLFNFSRGRLEGENDGFGEGSHLLLAASETVEVSSSLADFTWSHLIFIPWSSRDFSFPADSGREPSHDQPPLVSASFSSPRSFRSLRHLILLSLVHPTKNSSTLWAASSASSLDWLLDLSPVCDFLTLDRFDDELDPVLISASSSSPSLGSAAPAA
jgi:hypothetical protein